MLLFLAQLFKIERLISSDSGCVSGDCVLCLCPLAVSVGAASEAILRVDVTQNLTDIVAALSGLLETGNTFGTGQAYYTFSSCAREKYWLQNKGPQSSFSIFFFAIKAIR